MIELPAVIIKSQLRQFAQHYGAVNQSEVVIAGKKFEPRTVRYVTFSGEADLPKRHMTKAERAAMGELKLRGVHRFEPLGGAVDGAAFDFGILLNVQHDDEAEENE